uniref:Uncharacterized protein n=1 Tax=Chrysotila carterae TaxID=13221 RepID=A0A7S4B4H6_CHRCT|mmetsp:Transcript_24099/g.52578  ORF Transcript_24099/g.52578 Transcript_24099/m.52578 type:complete len:206 (+) Transcript_24099:45-662(+)
MGLKDETGETGIGGGVIWHKGPALTYVSPHEASVSAAHAACREGDADKLKSVLAADPSLLDAVQIDGTTPLMIAARAPTGGQFTEGRLECAKILIANGCKVNAVDMHGDSALTLASMCEELGSSTSTGICKLLLDAGADLAIQENNFKMTALHWAAQGGKTAVIKELLQSKKAPSVKSMKDREGMTPKQRAADAKKNADQAAAML